MIILNFEKMGQQSECFTLVTHDITMSYRKMHQDHDKSMSTTSESPPIEYNLSKQDQSNFHLL